MGRGTGADYKKHQKSLCLGSSDEAQGANATEYYPAEGGHGYAVEVDARNYIPFGCRITNFYIRSDVAPGAGETYQLTIMVNGVASTLDLTITNPNVVAGPDLSIVNLTAGDEISVRIITSLNAATARWTWSYELGR